MKLLNSPNFDSSPDNQWSQIPCPTFNSSTLEVVYYDLNIYLNRSDFKKCMHNNLNVFDLLAKSQIEKDENIRLYHGTDAESVKKICQYGINLNASHRLGSDFGPGFYVTDNFDDALHRAMSKSALNKTCGGVICFQIRDIEYHQFNVQELNETAEESSNPLEWSNFVKLCRRRFAEYPHMFRRDAFCGSVCKNAEKVYRTENERPQVKMLENRKPKQICIKSTTMASKLEGSIFGVYVIGISS
ncbi:unnamed protein product [Rotaria sordida]|uniref:PARP n=1 Tax=Rotaria sordida TaxID=392033 RepID=A0A814QUZ4_9BILA|nr:unnamed protein product [Rotaria sordida]CAF1425377.1 unnamed protein product [Rotaria sordida]